MTTTRSRRPEDTRLVEGLRELKDRSGLSLAGLSAKTTYSKSSWERYLNGKALPPRRAVEELCGLTGEPGARLLALLDLALQVPAPVQPPPAVQPPAPVQPPAEPGRQPKAPAPGRRRLLPVGIALGCAIATGAGFAFWPASSPPAAPTARCQGTACNGKSPASTFCGVQPATLATHHTAGGAQVDIRYSSRCRTAWARIGMSKVGDRIDITVAGQPAYEARVTDGYDAAGYVYTPMTILGSRHTVRVCVRPASGARQCFTASVGQGAEQGGSG